MKKDLAASCLNRRIQVYPSVATFKIVQSIAFIQGVPVAQVANKIISEYCNKMTLSERESLINKYDSSSDQS